MRVLFSAFALSLLLAANPAMAEESAYTDLDLGECKVLKRYEEAGGFDLSCPGLPNVDVFVSEGDARMDIDFGARNTSFDTFGQLNSLGSRIEWRLRNGEPFAAIVRHKLQVSENGSAFDHGEVLSVSTVGTKRNPGCPIAYVDALLNKNANTLARAAADEEASAFRCGTDRARSLGQVGRRSGDATAIVQQ